MLQHESSWLGRSVDHVLTYSGRQIAVGSQKPSRITSQKTCCASESNTSVRVVLANGSGFDAPIGVVLAWEERGSCLNIFWMTNHGRISETFTNYEGKDLLRNESNTSVRVVFPIRSGFDAPIGVFLAWEERESCLNIFRMTNRGRISETFTNYEARDLLRIESNTSVRVVFASFDAPIGVVLAWEEHGSFLNIFRTTNHGQISETFTDYEAKDLLRKSQKPSRITRQKTCCASESNTSVRVVYANQSGFDARIEVFLAREERGSCLNIFRTTNHGQISENFTNYEAKDLLRKSVDHVLTYSGRQIAVESHKTSRIMRQKTCCASESNTPVPLLFANQSGFDAPIGVVLAWEERGSYLNIIWTKNRGRISETSRITRQKTYCASESNTSVHVVFVNQSSFDAPIGVVMALEELGSCLNIFRMANRGRISETFTNYEAKDLLHN
ncbi:uncharacterized protein G2W53_014331 [Senna tora]|uniref:Uncharacterized protein n=1 Tax=Senna tora TaxID=362788 RepID=A0A834WT42_9FABA|nr:uncharacterized protein G2W53_014331 [Senna tora]